MNKKLIFIAGLALFLAVGPASPSLGGLAVAYANHAWSKYHWDLSTEETLANPLKIGDNLTAANWKNSLGGASSDWNFSVLGNAVVNGTSADCDPTLGQVEVCNASYGNNGWLGIAQIWVYRGRDGHIAQGVVKVNDTYFNLPAYNSDAWRNFVMCQEVGHTFGLDHQDENFSNTNLGTCMDYTNDPDGSVFSQLNNEHPNAHDYEMMEQIYAHINSPDSGPGNGKGGGNGRGNGNKPADVGADIDLNDPSEWGEAIRQDGAGNNSLYRRNLGNGFELITHVIWEDSVN